MNHNLTRRLLTVAAICACCPFTSSAETGIRILPGQIHLRGSEGTQRISLVNEDDGRIGAALEADEFEFRTSDPSVVEVVDGLAVARGNGLARVSAHTQDGREVGAEVSVTDCEGEHAWSFRHDVQSVFAKIGCNAGACHGAQSGKGGFKLSLRGYDSDADFLAITRQARGRRIELADPGRSLILAKPTGALPHKGGLKLTTTSRDYKVISEWIANGAAGPRPSDARLTRITVTPALTLLRPGDTSQVLVSAHYDDDTIVDVTHWAQYTATDEAIATVDRDGRVYVQGSGEGSVLVWFGSKVALARMTVPYANDVPDSVYATAPQRNYIDQLNLQQLRTLQLRPSPRCDDNAFLRRATLDTIGRLPTVAERAAYLAESSASRRDRLIERLCASDDFVDYWTYRWCDMLVINGSRLRPDAVKTYYDWVHDSVQQNKPWDQMVREIITATGESTKNGATNFYALNQTPEDMTENACQAFLGLSIGCAKCHNHPLEKWTNDQYYAMANLFARVRAKGWGGDGRSGNGHRTLFVTTNGELVQPNRGKPQPPAPLDSEPLEFDDPRDRRNALADWMTDSANPYFARAITNRIWANFFGQGLVAPVDDLRLSNPASNEALLTAAAQQVIDAGFDLKQVIRTILQSETYQRSSVPLEDNRDEFRYLSRYYPRRLMAEVLLDSIDQVLETSTTFDELTFPGADVQKTTFYQQGTRAIQLYDSTVSSYFLKTFGRNPREITCECERSDEPSMVQVLHLSNGETLNPKLSDEDNCLARKIAADVDDETIIKDLFIRALSREPTPQELTNLLAIRAEYGNDRANAIQDLAWGILTSTEFTFNH